MGIATDKLLEEALLLPADERASLVEKLLQSLNLPTEAEVDRLWVEEAERRVSQIEAGEVEVIPGEQVFAKIRAKYQR
ncbi:MAG TPA: addiction module antitoxin RelB [Nitrospiraceae bacterium]|nr:addiction module antitoxin RelB [Nitrospiraceae bacterium]